MIARSVSAVIMQALTVVQTRRPEGLSFFFSSNLRKKSLDSSGVKVPRSDCCPKFLLRARSFVWHGVHTKVFPCRRPAENGYSIPQNLHWYCTVVSAWGPSATDIVAEPERHGATAVAQERWPRMETKMATVFDKHIQQKPWMTDEPRGHVWISRQGPPRTRKVW